MTDHKTERTASNSMSARIAQARAVVASQEDSQGSPIGPHQRGFANVDTGPPDGADRGFISRAPGDVRGFLSSPVPLI